MSENTSGVSGITVTKGGTTITGDGIAFFQRSAAIRGLAMEVYTGMKLSNNGSGLDAVRAQGLLPEGRTTKKAGLREATKNMKKLYPSWEVSRTIQMALDK